MLPGNLRISFQVHSKNVPRYTSKDILKYTSDHTVNNAPNCTCKNIRRPVYSYVGSRDALKHTSNHALKYVSNCIPWNTPSKLGSILPSWLVRGKILPILPDYMPLYMLLGNWLRDLQSCSHQAVGWRRYVVGSGWHIVVEIITLINIKVWIISSLFPWQWDLILPYSYGIDNQNFTLSRKGRKLDLGTEIF